MPDKIRTITHLNFDATRGAEPHVNIYVKFSELEDAKHIMVTSQNRLAHRKTLRHLNHVHKKDANFIHSVVFLAREAMKNTGESYKYIVDTDVNTNSINNN